MKLDAEDLTQLAEQIAQRVTQQLREQPATRYVDAATLARLLGVRRDWVYPHADELGGVRLGGPRGRLRFDLATLPGRLARAVPEPSPPRSRRRRNRPQRGPSHAGATPVRLIPYHLESGPEHKKKPGGADTPPGPLHTGR